MDKKEARQAVLNLLNNNCDKCEKVEGMHVYKQINYCRENCPIYKELRRYGDLLDDEKRKKPAPKEPTNRGRLSEEEKLYLMSHVGIFSIKHIAKKLDRSIKSVYAKYYYLKKTSNSAK